jgi:hypothetical protein
MTPPGLAYTRGSLVFSKLQQLTTSVVSASVGLEDILSVCCFDEEIPEPKVGVTEEEFSN